MTVTYKGYQASISYEDRTLIVRVLHIDDILIGECGAAADVEKTFHDMVDDYLESCRELGRAPNKPFKGSFNVRVSPEIHRAVAMAAAHDEVSLNAWIADAIKEKLMAGETWKSLLLTEVSIREVTGDRASAWQPTTVIEKERGKILLEFDAFRKRYG